MDINADLGLKSENLLMLSLEFECKFALIKELSSLLKNRLTVAFGGLAAVFVCMLVLGDGLFSSERGESFVSFIFL